MTARVESLLVNGDRVDHQPRRQIATARLESLLVNCDRVDHHPRRQIATARVEVFSSTETELIAMILLLKPVSKILIYLTSTLNNRKNP